MVKWLVSVIRLALTFAEWWQIIWHRNNTKLSVCTRFAADLAYHCNWIVTKIYFWFWIQVWIRRGHWSNNMHRVIIVWRETMPKSFKFFTQMQEHWVNCHCLDRWICASTAANCNRFVSADFDWVRNCFYFQYSCFHRWFSSHSDRNRCSHFLSVCYLANAIFKHKLFPFQPCPKGCVAKNPPLLGKSSYKSRYYSSLTRLMHIGQDVPEETTGTYCVEVDYAKHCPFNLDD